MKQYLRVDIDRGLAGQDVTVFEQLDGDESESDLDVMAADTFANYCSYGFSVVDKSDVPEDERG